MPAHLRGGAAFLGRVPNLNELEVNGLIGASGQVQWWLLREPLYLQPAQPCQGQQAQQRRGRYSGRQCIPPTELSRPIGEIILTIAQTPDILQK
jgi:hypothetical protein